MPNNSGSDEPPKSDNSVKSIKSIKSIKSERISEEEEKALRQRLSIEMEKIQSRTTLSCERDKDLENCKAQAIPRIAESSESDVDVKVSFIRDNCIFAACAAGYAAVKQRIMDIVMVCKHSPSCLIVPLLVLVVTLGLGLFGVFVGADSAESHERDVAEAVANSTARSFQLELQQAYAPVITLQSLVKLEPYWPRLAEMFAVVGPSLYEPVSGQGLIEIQFAPLGIITHSYPPDPAAEGKDLLFIEDRRAVALETIAIGQMTLAGPLLLFRGTMGLMVRQPIYLPNMDSDEECLAQLPPNVSNTTCWFGMPHEAYKCDICYNPATRTKFWGFSIAIIDWPTLVNEQSHLGGLATKGYKFFLKQAAPGGKMIISAASPDPPSEHLPDKAFVTAKVNTHNTQGAAMAVSDSFTDHWMLQIIPLSESYSPGWVKPAIAGVVVGSVLIAGLVFAVMVNRMQHILAKRDIKISNAALAKMTEDLTAEQRRLDALLVRQYDLINMFDQAKGPTKRALQGAESGFGEDAMDRIEAMRRTINEEGQAVETPVLQMMELLGEGSFGKVYRGLWRGTEVAIKTLVLPSNMSSAAKREKMAIMEAAISSSLSHPNIVQTYTYTIKPLRDEVTQLLGNAVIISQDASMAVSPIESTACASVDQHPMASSVSNLGTPGKIHSYEVRLVLEYCDKDNLKEALELCAFQCDEGLNYRAILDTVKDVAKAMLHLHAFNVLHGDLKASNVMLKSTGGDGRGIIAKVGDFGLSVKMNNTETHLSAMFQGTMTHMAPELLLEGRASKAADVYAFGITMYEIFTGQDAFRNIPAALLGHQITKENHRPVFPMCTPVGFRNLAERCWHQDPAQRPSFETVLEELIAMRSAMPGPTAPINFAAMEEAKARAKAKSLAKVEAPPPEDIPNPIMGEWSGGVGAGGRGGRARRKGGGGAGDGIYVGESLQKSMSVSVARIAMLPIIDETEAMKGSQ